MRSAISGTRRRTENTLSKHDHAILKAAIEALLLAAASRQRLARRRRDAAECKRIAEFAHEVDLVGCKLFAMAKGL